MQKFLITSVVAILSMTAMAQDKKVAVFDPAGSVDISLKEIVREEISSIIVNTGGFTVLERQLIDKVLEENKFQSGGLVDDSQVSEIGKRMGANLVFVSSITTMGTNLYLSCKMIDVLTARIEKQRTAQTQSEQADLISVVQGMVSEMFGITLKAAETLPQTSRQVVEKTNRQVVEEKVSHLSGVMLVANGRRVNQGARQLTPYEVRKLMTNNTDALQLYNKGISKNRNGNICLWSGVGLYAVGIVFMAAATPDEYYSDGKGHTEINDGNGLGTLGSICFTAGSGAIIAGIILKITSKKPVENAVDMYNRGAGRTTGIELKFGITGNGIGLALAF